MILGFDARLDHPRDYSLIVERGERRGLVVGAPHHAPAGVSRLPCGRDADENAGYLACYLGQYLQVPSVVAVNCLEDANKSLDTGYGQELQQIKPALLVELHGHGGRSARADVEISAGSKQRESYALQLSAALQREMKKDSM